MVIEATKGQSINCFGFLSRSNDFFYKLTQENITSAIVLETIEDFSWQITRQTVLVLDNARPNTARKIKERIEVWQKRDLYIFYLPPYSPHLNIIERLWKEFKEGWLKPSDYQTAHTLFYAVNRICAAIGKELFMHFKPFNFNSK